MELNRWPLGRQMGSEIMARCAAHQWRSDHQRTGRSGVIMKYFSCGTHFTVWVLGYLIVRVSRDYVTDFAVEFHGRRCGRGGSYANKKRRRGQGEEETVGLVARIVYNFNEL